MRRVQQRFFVTLVCGSVTGLCGCPGATNPPQARGPFRGLAPVSLDGTPQALPANLAALGDFDRGDVVRLDVRGPAVQAVLVLLADETEDGKGRLVGGGPGNAVFDYSIRITGRYFVFVHFDATVGQEAGATLTATAGDPAVLPPAEQFVRVEFANGYLTDPGLFDPIDGTDEERQLLADLSLLVRDGIVDRLRTIFAETPIVILSDDDALPANVPVSVLRFEPDRVLADDQEIVDAALPPADPSRPQCQVRVVFGEVLPSGTQQDPGNRVRDDQAVVYVGSFQGRGRECWTSAVNSANSIVLTLAQTAAHEIGHLVGLYHVEQIDLMNRSATLAFLRELQFARGQIQLERIVDGELISEVVPSIVQDPAMYFQAVFGEGVTTSQN